MELLFPIRTQILIIKGYLKEQDLKKRSSIEKDIRLSTWNRLLRILEVGNEYHRTN